MKKLLTIGAISLLGAGSLLAQQYDIYLSGSTAFRNNCYDAATKLFDGGAPALLQTDGTSPANKSTLWAMSGTCSNILGTTITNTVVIHGSWNGSVAGYFALGQKFGVPFFKSSTPTVPNLVTNTPTGVLSDVDSRSTLYPLSSGSFWEKYVCVQPFIFVKSISPLVSGINNVAFGQLQQMLANSAAPLSQFTGNVPDTNTTVYLVERTLDSGTRVTQFAEAQFSGAVNNIYYYDNVGNTGYFVATTNRFTGSTLDPLFTAGGFGFGYVGGGDIANVLKINQNNNTAIAGLSFADAKSVTAINWGNMLAYNGQYPILNYVPGVAPTTNDFGPVITGKYSFWAYEVMAWAKQSQYGTYTDQPTPYTVVSALLNKLSGYNGTTSTKGSFVGGTGSFDNEILVSQASGAPTAIRLNDMHSSRQSVGGPISTF
jgi:hypothetical protein